MANKNKKISEGLAYSFLGVLGVVTLIFGVASLGQIIGNPARQAELTRQGIVEELTDSQLASEQLLRTQDTDQDGLVDFDELNLYGTSPYLADSDSDGFTDKQEIDSGNDPNCPAGTSCRSLQVEASAESTESSTGFKVGSFEDLLDLPTEVSETSSVDLTNLTPDQIKQLLLESGDVTQEQLDQIDDATLMQVYQDVLNSQNQPESTETGDDQTIDLTNLTPDQIRQLLLESGKVTQEQLDQIDDATLMQIYQDELNQN